MTHGVPKDKILYLVLFLKAKQQEKKYIFKYLSFIVLKITDPNFVLMKPLAENKNRRPKTFLLMSCFLSSGLFFFSSIRLIG